VAQGLVDHDSVIENPQLWKSSVVVEKSLGRKQLNCEGWKIITRIEKNRFIAFPGLFSNQDGKSKLQKRGRTG
jgi:hypothetical protein